MSESPPIELTPLAAQTVETNSEKRLAGVFVALYLAAFLVSLDRAVFAPLLPAIASDFKVSIAAVGLAVSAYTLPYGLFQLAYGPLADRSGKLAVMRWSFLIFAFGTGLCAVALTLPALDVLRAITGACAASVVPLSLAFIGDAVPYQRRQPFITNLMGATSAGNALSAAFGGIVGQFLSWRALFALYGVVSLVLTVGLFRTSGEPARVSGPAPAKTERNYGQVLRLRRAQILFILVGLEGVVNYGSFTYLGAYLKDFYGINYLVVGLILAAYGTGTLITSRVVHLGLRRLGEANLILVGGIMFALGYLALLPIGWWPLTVPPMLLMGAGFALFHSTLQTRATELVPALRGTSVALFAFSLFLGGGIGTAVLGVMVSTMGYQTMIVFSGVMLLAITAIARRTW